MIIKITDQIRLWKKDSNDKKISWAELELKANEIDVNNEREYKKLLLKEKNSLINIVERYAELKFQRKECKECQKLLIDEFNKAIIAYKKTGSIEEQILSGKSFIVRNPDQQIIDLKYEKTIVFCLKHKKNTIIEIELRRIIHNSNLKS